MGNITSGQGNNFKTIVNDDGSETEIKTPLNLFIEKVFNDDYFFSANLSDDMINKVNQSRKRNENGDKNVNNENEYVLLKRAACTANTHIPIVLPSVDCLYDDEGKEIPGSCRNNWEKAPQSVGNGYTVKIHVRDHTGKPLSDYQKSTTPQQVIDNLDDLEDLVNEGKQPTDPKLIPLYNYLKQIHDMNILSKDNEYYAEVAESDKGGGSVIVGSKLCTNFYAGTNLGEDGINYKNVNLSQREINQKKPLQREYNSMDMAGNSVSGAFCGKVYQYEHITGRDEARNPIKQYLTKLMPKNTRGVGNKYIIDNFPDCACLNSIGARLREEMNKSKQQTRLLLEKEGIPHELDKDNLIAQEIAQNNDMYCHNNLLSTSQKHQSAYIMDNNLLKEPVKICSNFSITQDIEVEEGAEFKADANCGPDSIQEKVSACLLDRSKCSEEELKELEKREKIQTWIIIVVSIVGVVVVAGIVFIIYKLRGRNVFGKTSSKASAEVVPLIEPPGGSNKYSIPSSDPLFR